ncbi:MAG: hypothetical protein H7339_09375 [Arcicella sp.]|nr:hypothetical protein [Arcicella sp.]
MAPQTFEGYSEIGYRITDSNWNIDFLGTVKIYAQSSAQNSIPIIIPLVGNIEMPSLTITPIKEIPHLKRLIYAILTGTLLMGIIVYFSIKKRL